MSEHPGTQAEWLAYYAQRVDELERELEELSPKRDKQRIRRRRAIELFHMLTREWSAETRLPLYRSGGRLESVRPPATPEEALEHVAHVFGYPDTAHGFRAARRWLARAKSELRDSDPANQAPVPPAWSE